MFPRLQKALAILAPGELSFSRDACALCGFGFQVCLCADELGVRCARCGASAVTQSLADVLRSVVANLGDCDVCELSAAGPLVRWLRSAAGSLTTSEYYAETAPGQFKGEVQCQDVQRLTYADGSFDVCTSTEVFEHVEDDIAGFRETCRVLKPNGLLVFTVPLRMGFPTIERTGIANDMRTMRLPAEYHADRHGTPVFCYRNYGDDILARLERAGFDAEFQTPGPALFGFRRPVVVARKIRGDLLKR